MRNSAIEDSLNRKMKLRWLGPLVVIRQSSGGSYILAELDGSVLYRKIAKFRVIPYFARKRIALPKNIHDWIDLSDEQLKDLIDSKEPEDGDHEISRDFWFGSAKITESDADQVEVTQDEEEESSSTRKLRSHRD